MNKTWLSMFLFVVFLSLTLVGISLAADNEKETPPFIRGKVSTGVSPAVEGSGGVNSLSGSYVAFDPSVGGDICHIPGVAQTFCFRAESFTNDYEYVYNIWEKFPTNWVISNVYVQGTPVCDTGNWGPFSWSFVTSPYEVNIYQPRYQQTADHCIAYYCFDVTAGPGLMDAGVSWFWNGDEYGAPPHWPCSNDGYAPSGFTCDEAVNPVATVPVCNIEPVVWDKNIDGIPWSPGIEITRQTSDTFAVQEVLHLSSTLHEAVETPFLIPTILPYGLPARAASTVTQVETWDPDQLRLLDWAATGGNVTVNPGQLTWSAEILASTTMTLTKWFHTEPCTWTQTVLSEELWLNSTLLEQRPVTIHKLPPDLWVDASGGGVVHGGQPASFALLYGNRGGFENDTWVRNSFPPEAPFHASDPPPDDVDPNGLWAAWNTDGLPMGAQDSISVTVMIQPDLPPATTIEIWEGIINHVGEVAHWVTMFYHIAESDIEVTPLLLEITLPPGETGTLPFTISNVGTADLTWDLTSNADWLSEDITSGNLLPAASANIVATFNATTLAAGEYPTSILVNSNDPDSPVVTIEVMVIVEGTPDIEVTAPALEMTLPPGETGTLDFTISNIGAGNLEWNLADAADWLSEDLASGSLLPEGSTGVRLTFDTAGLTPGSYSTRLTINSNDPDEPSISLHVSLTVSEAGYQIHLPIITR